MGTALKILFALVVVQIQACSSQICNEYGFYCASCRDYQLCIDDVPAGPASTCPDGYFCSTDTECGLEDTCPLPNECTSAGRFPDTTSCSKYYTCQLNSLGDWEKLELVCPGTSVFNPQTLKCTAASNYVCLIADEEALVSTTVAATTVAVTTTETPTEITTTETPTELTTTETPETTTIGPFVCTQEGVFPNPTDCQKYYRCTATLVANEYICPGTSYFNEVTLKCSYTLSPKCQALVSSTTPSTTSSSTTPSTTTSSTTPTTTPSTTPSTTTSSTTPSTTTTGPFVCTTAGVFPHPTDCQKYYRCTSTLIEYEYICPGSSYFNEVTLKCSLTPTARCKAPTKGQMILGMSNKKSKKDVDDDDDDDENSQESEKNFSWKKYFPQSFWSHQRSGKLKDFIPLFK